MDKSKALSQTYLQPKSIAIRMIADLVGDGFDGEASPTTKKALEDKGITLKLVASLGGIVNCDINK